MAKWSDLWKLPKQERAEAIKKARFTPPSPAKPRGKKAPHEQSFNKT